MARRVFCRIVDRPDGLFDVTATIEPDKTCRREGVASLAEAEHWIDGLRTLMTALGAPVLRVDAAEGGGPRPRGRSRSTAGPARRSGAGA